MSYKRKAQEARRAQARIRNAAHSYGEFSRCLKKNAYGSQKEAGRVAARAVSDRGGYVRVYQCPNCSFYHLTSKKSWR